MEFLDEVMNRCPNLRAEFSKSAPTAEEIERIEAERQSQWRQEEKRRRESRLVEFLRARGTRYKNCRLENFEITNDKQKNVVEQLAGYGEDMKTEVEQGNGVILFGPSGTGKDHLLVGLARAAILRHGFDVLWKNGPDIFAEFRAAIADNKPERHLIHDLTTVSILVLSDPTPPTGELTEYQVSTLFRVLDARYSACRPTWVTMNVANSAEADRRLGVASVDRLRHNSLALHCDWPSHRKRKVMTS